MKKYIAELVGTAILVIGGVGAAVLSAGYMGALGVAMAFGLSLLIISYTIGVVSGGHVNPAVTFGLALAGKFPKAEVFPYIVFQVIGGLIGGTIIWVINGMTTIKTVLMNGAPVAVSDFAGNVLVTGNLLSGLVVEIVMTAILVLAALFTTHHKFPMGLGGLLLGAVLTLIHVVSIPITNTSVNPARSIAVAFFQGGQAVSDLWVFIVAPLAGALVAVGIYRLMVNHREMA